MSIAGLLLTGLEGVLRLAGFEHHWPNPIIIVPLWNTAGDRETERLQVMHRFHPYWFWEPRPGARVVSCGTERINAAGYRGPARPRSPSRGTLRVVIMGDSSTFGMGVCGDETYPALLERELPNAEVLNFGVIGFTAFQGEKFLEGRVLAYHPHVVLVAFGAVDELLPASGHDVDAKFRMTSQASPRAVLWRDRLSGLRTFQLVELAFERTSEGGIELRAHENWEKFIHGSRDYMRNQSVASFERSLESMIKLGRSHGARVALIVPPRPTTVERRWPWANEYSAAIERVASRLDAPYWDARAAFRVVANSNERLFLDTYHPNVAGHQLYAKFLAEKILHDLGYDSRQVTTRQPLTRGTSFSGGASRDGRARDNGR